MAKQALAARAERVQQTQNNLNTMAILALFDLLKKQHAKNIGKPNPTDDDWISFISSNYTSRDIETAIGRLTDRYKQDPPPPLCKKRRGHTDPPKNQPKKAKIKTLSQIGRPNVKMPGH